MTGYNEKQVFLFVLKERICYNAGYETLSIHSHVCFMLLLRALGDLLARGT